MRPFSNHLTPGRLQQLHMLLRVRLVDVTLSNLLHHEVCIDVNFLAQLTVGNAPLAGYGEHANGGLGVDQGIDAGGGVGEGEFVCCLWGVSNQPS
jgi:hypothetical protein